MHCHTVAGGHAYGTLEENLAQAKEIGLLLTGTAEHGPRMPGSCPLLHFEEIMALPDKIDGMHWLKGVEANIMEEGLDVPDELLSRLDFVIASIHLALYLPGDKAANTAAVVRAMEHPHVDIIGHLGDPGVPVDVEAIVKAAKRTGTIIEINNSSLTPGSYRYDGGKTVKLILEACKREEVYVLAGSDAHHPKKVGSLELAKALIVESGIKEELVLNTDVQLFISVLRNISP